MPVQLQKLATARRAVTHWRTRYARAQSGQHGQVTVRHRRQSHRRQRHRGAATDDVRARGGGVLLCSDAEALGR